jgi:hypothetical protein
MNIPKMELHGGMLITNDDERIDVSKATLKNNRVFYTLDDKEESIPLLSIKEARPLSLDHELPTRRDEAPIDDRDDDREENVNFTPEFCIELQGNDTIECRLSSRKDYKAYDIEFGPTPLVRCNAFGDIPPPSKLVRSQAIDPLPKKRKFDDYEEKEIPPTVVCTPLLEPCENALHEFPELRPGFLEPLPVSPRNIKVTESKVKEVEMIPKSEYNKLEDDFARLLKLMFKNNYSTLQDACENGYKVKIRDSYAEQKVYSVMYTFENKEESYVILVNEQDKTVHMSIQDIITVIPSISKEKFYDIEPVNISNSDYWLFSTLIIDGENFFIHKNTGIIVSINKEDVYLEAIPGDKKYSSEEIEKIKDWIKRSGIKVYEKEAPITPIRERRSAELRAPRKERKCSNFENAPNCSRKLDFSTVKEQRVRKSAELRAPRKSKYSESNEDMIQFFKNNIDKVVKLNYKEEPKVVTVKSITDKHLIGICNRDKHIKKYILDYICDLEIVDKKEQKASLDYDEYFKKPDVKNALREASRNNKSIFIKYARGSIPDIKRPIRVIGFQNGENGNDLVVAECLIEGSIRKFKIEHIEIVA